MFPKFQKFFCFSFFLCVLVFILRSQQQTKKMYQNHNYEMNNKLEDIPEECSIKHKHLPITQTIWKNFMKRLCAECDENEMKIEIDLLTKKNKPTHPIVRNMLYAKAKEQYLAGHGFEFAFYQKSDVNFETLICFHEGNYKMLPNEFTYRFVR